MDIIPKPMLNLIADRFKLLSSPTRLDILQHICEEEKTVGTLVKLTGCKQANVSRHLGLLDRSGVVTRRVDGNFVFYRVADQDLPRLCDVMRESIRKQQVRMKASIDSQEASPPPVPAARQRADDLPTGEDPTS